MIKGAAPAAVDFSACHHVHPCWWRNQKPVPSLWPRQPAQRPLLRRLTVCHFQRRWDAHATSRRNSPHGSAYRGRHRLIRFIRSVVLLAIPTNRARNEHTQSGAASLSRSVGRPPVSIRPDSGPEFGIPPPPVSEEPKAFPGAG